MNRYRVDYDNTAILDMATAERALVLTIEAAEMFAEDLNNGAYDRDNFVWTFIKEGSY